jgi:hypothetical protein
MPDLLIGLESWFTDNCDGDWEHGWGVRINTLDNPGWSVDIDLAGTLLFGKPFAQVREERAENDWVHCWIDAGVFKGRGGPKNLSEILGLFLSWSGAKNGNNA